MRSLAGARRVPAAMAETYYAQGWWRRESFVDDLRDAASAVPGRTAFINWRRDEGREVTVTFGELAEYVGRLSSGLRELGVRPGGAVAFQLPNWWETAALTLACLDAGAVAVPMMMTLGAREVERVLAGTQATVRVTVDHRDDQLPLRMAFGNSHTTRVIPFTDLLAGSRAPRTPLSRAGDGGSDEVSLVLFTSGTTGEAKGVLHTPNTQYASTRPRHGALRDVRDPRVATPADLTHSVGMRTNVLTPLVARCTSVFADTRDPEIWLDLLARHHVTHFLGAPQMLGNLARAQRRRRRPLPDLCVVTSTGAPLPASLVAPLRELLCPRLVNGFGMTETGGLTLTAVDDPPDWPGQSIGRPTPGREARLVPDTPDSDGREAGGTVFRLQVRGPSVCVGTFELSSGRLTWAPDTTGGWYDTGDLVGEDGRGGLRYLSRVADRIGSPHPIPVLEVEDELLGHPAVADVAIVGCQNADGVEMVCAVVVPEGTPPTLDGLRAHLLQRGMTEWYLPTHLTCVNALPRNPLGKVMKNKLRDHLRTPTEA
ncbi:AMP-binding protein [Sphaerisporangium flaviroseum]|uniref:AMP-binding protein n=1 Tax=Sphaerisporangium flaviroseum TaxID=509199 RepID=A0ABP7I6T2_9ACTN